MHGRVPLLRHKCIIVLRYYFASEVANDGGIPEGYVIHGPAHATAYWNLVQRKEQGQWDVRYVKVAAIVRHI